MTYAYRRASKAMFVTQITTFFAFLATASSPLRPIAAFGYWASLIVAADYVLVITMYPAVLMIHYKYIKSCESKYICCCFENGCKCCKCCCTGSPSDKSIAKDVTSNVSDKSTKDTSQKNSKNAKPAENGGVNEVQLAVAGTGTSGAKNNSDNNNDGAATGKDTPTSAKAGPSDNSNKEFPSMNADKSPEPSYDEYRRVERFCGGTWVDIILKIRYISLVFFAIVSGISLYLIITGKVNKCTR